MKTKTLKPASSRRIKAFHKLLGSHLPLKGFANALASRKIEVEGLEGVKLASDWLFNKRANTSHALKGIGRTNRVGGGQNASKGTK